MKNRELLNLLIVSIIAAIFAFFSISINFIDKLYSFFKLYTTFRVGEFFINVIFLWLVGLLWLIYHRWREAAKEKVELESIISSISPDVLMVVDSDRNITICNPSVKGMFGYEVDEVINQKIDILYFDPEQYYEILEVLKRVGFHIGLATGKKKNGETIPLEIIAGNLVGRDGTALFIRDITERKREEEERKESMEKLLRAMRETIQAMAITVEKRDPYTADHQRRVTKLAYAIAKEMDLPQEQIDGIYTASIIHDIGKMYIPAEILSKPGSLTKIEYSMIETHPQVGYDILKEIGFPWPVAQIVLQHHERMDGSGYPQGLSGEDILLEARILGVADVVEAMASHRPYRPAHGIDKALGEISQNRGVLYDPEVVDVCLRLFTKKGFKFE